MGGWGRDAEGEERVEGRREKNRGRREFEFETSVDRKFVADSGFPSTQRSHQLHTPGSPLRSLTSAIMGIMRDEWLCKGKGGEGKGREGKGGERRGRE